MSSKSLKILSKLSSTEKVESILDAINNANIYGYAASKVKLNGVLGDTLAVHSTKIASINLANTTIVNTVQLDIVDMVESNFLTRYKAFEYSVKSSGMGIYQSDKVETSNKVNVLSSKVSSSIEPFNAVEVSSIIDRGDRISSRQLLSIYSLIMAADSGLLSSSEVIELYQPVISSLTSDTIESSPFEDKFGILDTVGGTFNLNIIAYSIPKITGVLKVYNSSAVVLATVNVTADVYGVINTILTEVNFAVSIVNKNGTVSNLSSIRVELILDVMGFSGLKSTLVTAGITALDSINTVVSYQKVYELKSTTVYSRQVPLAR